MPILDLNNADKLYYQGVEYDKLYFGGNELWKKKPNFVPLPLPNDRTPDVLDGTTAKWTVRGITPNKRYQISIYNVRGGIMRISQQRLGDSDLRVAGVNYGLASASINVTSPNGIIYVTMSDVYTGTPTLTINPA
ncbi:TPA: hypothetical protein K8071_000470 [Staphylococcus pseudintermedius]|nr:hypothetical protein [Staphylococcus pseudintermedius]